MMFSDKIPPEIAERLADHLGHVGEFRYALAGDLTLDRRYGRSYLAVTDGQIGVCDTDGQVLSVPLDEVKEVKVDELFGGARLVAVTEAGERSLIYYTKAYVPEFATMCRVLNDLKAGREPKLPAEPEHAFCPKCGMMLPERGGNCPKCVARWEVVRRLLGLIRPYRGRAIILVVLTFIGVGSQVVPPLLTKYIVDGAIRGGDLAMLAWLVGGMVGCGLLLLLTRLAGGALSIWFAGRITADLRHRLHAHMQRLQLSYFNRRDTGEIQGRIMHDTMELEHFLIDGLPYLMVELVSVVAIGAILVLLDPLLALLVFLPVPFLIGGGGWFWKRLIPLFHKYGSRRERLHTILGESVKGVKSVKAFSQEDRRSREFGGVNESMFHIGFRIDRTFVGFFEVMFWIMSIGVAAVWLFGGVRIIGTDPAGPGAFTLGTLLAFIGYLWLFYGPLQWFTTVLNWMSHAFSGAERIFNLLDSQPEVYDAPDAISLPKLEGAIAFRDVRFSYERGQEVIKGVSFDVAPGEMIGLVGKSGAGKSTIINLVCRFYDIDSGSLTVDGHPIDELKLQELRSRIGIVMQEPFLFNGTVLDNIRYGVPEATFEEVIAASQAARCHDFIVEKEDGYDTFIGEAGAALSGGEKQRVAIARAILHDPAILILDEATSSVDSETEGAIQEAITHLIRNRTTIAIAHRLATLRNANRLIVIDDGKIAEIGTHDELLAADGQYAKLVQMQTKLSRLKATVWEEG